MTSLKHVKSAAVLIPYIEVTVSATNDLNNTKTMFLLMFAVDTCVDGVMYMNNTNTKVNSSFHF